MSEAEVNLEFMKTNPREIFLFYDANSSIGRKTRAVAISMTPHVNDREFHKTPWTTTLWRNLLEKLQLRPKDLMNRAHPYYQQNIRGRDFDDEGWLRILINNPEIIKAPIAIRGNKAILISTPTDILKLIKGNPTAREESKELEEEE